MKVGDVRSTATSARDVKEPRKIAREAARGETIENTKALAHAKIVDQKREKSQGTSGVVSKEP